MSDRTVEVEPQGDAARDPSTRRVLLVATVIFVLALSIRLVDIGGRSLWVDEGATAINAGLGWERLLDGADADLEHPPGYYALISLTMEVSASETGLRVPSAVASSLAAVVAFLVGRRLGGNRLGMLAAAILIVSPLDLWYAQEARQPVFAALAIIGAFWGLAHRGWLGYSVSTAALFAGLYLDYITAAGWAVAGAMWVVIWARTDLRRVLDWALVTAVAAVLYAPVEGTEFFSGFQKLLGYQGAGIWYGELLGSNPVTSNAFGLLVVAAVAGAIAFALGDRLTRKGRLAGLVAISVVVVFAIGSALSPIPRGYSVKKILVVGWPVVALVIAYLILNRVGTGWRRPLIVGLLATSLIGSAMSFLVPKDDWRAMTAHINAHAEPGDVAWAGPDPWAADAYHYYQGALPVYLDAEPSATDLPSEGDVWVMTYRRPQDTAPALAAEAWFDENWQLVEEIPFYRLAIRRYAP